MKTLEEAWKIIDDRYGDVRIQLKCIKQELLNMRSHHKSTHEGIISMVSAINQSKHITEDLKVEDKLKVDD